MGGLLTTLGRRAKSAGVKLVYHDHMGDLGEKPEGDHRGARGERPGVPSASSSTWRTTRRPAATAPRGSTSTRRASRWSTPRTSAPCLEHPTRRRASRPTSSSSWDAAGSIYRGPCGPQGSGLSWLGDPRAGRRSRPGRHAAGVDADQQDIHRTGPQAAAVNVPMPSVPLHSVPTHFGARALVSLAATVALAGAGLMVVRADVKPAGPELPRHPESPGQPAAGRRAGRWQAVHILSGPRHAEEADALPDPHRRPGTVITRGFPPEPVGGAAITRTTSASGSTTATSTATTSGTTPPRSRPRASIAGGAAALDQHPADPGGAG